MKIPLLYISLIFGAITCMDPAIDSKLKLINSSHKPVLIYYNTDGQIATSYYVNGVPPYNAFHEFQGADTTRGYQRGLMKDNPNYIAAGDTIAASLGMGSWEGHINDGKLRIYLFDPETVLKNEWKTLWVARKWSKTYSLTLEQVKARNWAIPLR